MYYIYIYQSYCQNVELAPLGIAILVPIDVPVIVLNFEEPHSKMIHLALKSRMQAQMM
jgi:hypothetical protein